MAVLGELHRRRPNIIEHDADPVERRFGENVKRDALCPLQRPPKYLLGKCAPRLQIEEQR